ncbi:MAG: hypothetical protein P9L99_14135 [Candidatus Lernaella stagnicola]|nr:hypothetical protein [Candidatus Lernaella stagnicola]
MERFMPTEAQVAFAQRLVVGAIQAGLVAGEEAAGMVHGVREMGMASRRESVCRETQHTRRVASSIIDDLIGLGAEPADGPLPSEESLCPAAPQTPITRLDGLEIDDLTEFVPAEVAERFDRFGIGADVRTFGGFPTDSGPAPVQIIVEVGGERVARVPAAELDLAQSHDDIIRQILLAANEQI